VGVGVLFPLVLLGRDVELIGPGAPAEGDAVLLRDPRAREIARPLRQEPGVEHADPDSIALERLRAALLELGRVDDVLVPGAEPSGEVVGKLGGRVDRASIPLGIGAGRLDERQGLNGGEVGRLRVHEHHRQLGDLALDGAVPGELGALARGERGLERDVDGDGAVRDAAFGEVGNAGLGRGIAVGAGGDQEGQTDPEEAIAEHEVLQLMRGWKRTGPEATAP
jgi:hypothetical protein